MHFIYVLKSKKDDNLYIGCSADVEKRLKEHNVGKVRSTKSRVPFVLVYKEAYQDKYEAFFRERYYKTAKGKKEIKEKISRQNWEIV